MGEFKDLKGLKFGNLQVIEKVDSINKTVVYKCLCDCGNTAIVPRPYLIYNGKRIASCGCKKSIGYKPDFNKKEDRALSIFHMLYKRFAKSCIKKFNYETDIDVIRFIELSKAKCFYCNREHSNEYKSKLKNKNFNIYFNGIDRIDSNKPYLLNNVVTCCKYCNMFKNTMSIAEFKTWVVNVYTNFIKNETKNSD